MSDSNGTETKSRVDHLEHALVVIQEAVRRAGDDPEKALRFIGQRVEWALNGVTVPPGDQIMADLEGQEVAAPIPGFRFEVSVSGPCTLRLSVDPLGNVDGNDDGPVT